MDVWHWVLIGALILATEMGVFLWLIVRGVGEILETVLFPWLKCRDL